MPQRRGPKGIDWAKVREEYAKGTSYTVLASMFDVDQRTIKGRKQTDALKGIIWAREGSENESGENAASQQTVEPPQKPVTNVIRLPRRGEEATAFGEYDDPNEKVTIADALAYDARVAMKMMRLADHLLDALFAGEILPGQNQSKADVAEKVATVAQRAQEITRKSAGIKDGSPSVVVRSDDDGRLVIEQQVIEPKMLPVNEKGRVAR